MLGTFCCCQLIKDASIGDESKGELQMVDSLQ